MNREMHLRQSLPRWLKLPEVAELIIVDWSNKTSLRDLCSIDRRVKVVRVEQEPKWALSYAYNVGISRALHPFIIKCDADCIPHPEISALLPDPSHFFAGHWKSGSAVGKPSVNGQCLFLKLQFDAVNGYSELIRSYGRDDEDFYDRMIAQGYERREIAPANLDFIEHTNVERTVNCFAPNEIVSPEKRIFRETMYTEMYNCYLARLIPWNRASRRAVYTELQREDRFTVLVRDQSQEIIIPPDIEAAAQLLALRYVARNLAALSAEAADKLDERACLAMITPRLKAAKPGA